MTDTSKKSSIKNGCLLALFGISVLFLFGGLYAKNVLIHQAGFWEYQIKRYERGDKKHPPLTGSILFIGSSSIHYWTTLAQDMKPLPVINRGFGGSHIHHITHFSERILFPYKPKIIVIYSGENDLSSGTPIEEVHKNLQQLVLKIRTRLPNTQLFFISAKPSSLRYSYWPLFQKFNARVQAWIKTQHNIKYIDVSAKMHKKKDQLREDIFRKDRLHLNKQGYMLWTSIIRPPLQKAWNALKPQPSSRPSPSPIRK